MLYYKEEATIATLTNEQLLAIETSGVMVLVTYERSDGRTDTRLVKPQDVDTWIDANPEIAVSGLSLANSAGTALNADDAAAALGTAPILGELIGGLIPADSNIETNLPQTTEPTTDGAVLGGTTQTQGSTGTTTASPSSTQESPTTPTGSSTGGTIEGSTISTGSDTTTSGVTEAPSSADSSITSTAPDSSFTSTGFMAQPTIFGKLNGDEVLNGIIDKINGQNVDAMSGTTDKAIFYDSFDFGSVFDSAEGTTFTDRAGTTFTKEDLLGNKTFTLTGLGGITDITLSGPLQNYESLIKAGVPVDQIVVNPLPPQQALDIQALDIESLVNTQPPAPASAQVMAEQGVPTQTQTDVTGRSGQ